ncbi:MAG TPA: nucleoside triphosphate pyrophosphohydrolase [Chloroflexota bacterium]|nr:nucleoside triphosphate pyrophosphohydrolase [Chloroflexota bacterium]
MAITIVGLGPGPYRALSLEAAEALQGAGELYLRTAQHSTVAELPASIRWTAFDDLYEQATSFEALYDEIAALLLGRGAKADVTYAVPGHPLIGEASVRRLLERATATGVPTRVIGGMSFAEAALAARGVSPGVDDVQIADAMALPPIAPTVPLLVHQVYKTAVASDLKLALLRLYPPEHEALVIRAATTAQEAVERVAIAALDRGVTFDHLTTVYVPPIPPDEDFGTLTGLAHLVARLRRPGGCPWDAQQTHESLKRYILEEAYEAAEAIDEQDFPALCDELGDLLLQVALQSELADEHGAFDLNDVLHAICAKLVRRHPHVFGSTVVADAREVELNWEEIKRRERGGTGPPPSVLDGLPRHQPALMTSQALVKRLRGADLAPASRADTLAASEAALRELAAAETPAAREASLGRALFALAHLARLDGVDAEEALRQANRRLAGRVRAWEERQRASGAAARVPSGDDLAGLWEDAVRTDQEAAAGPDEPGAAR